VDRVFREGAGFPKQSDTTDPRTAAARAKVGVVGVAEAAKRRAMERLREMVDTSGECDRIMTGMLTSVGFDLRLSNVVQIALLPTLRNPTKTIHS
jgi:chromosome transmission fidelity protein 18